MIKRTTRQISALLIMMLCVGCFICNSPKASSKEASGFEAASIDHVEDFADILSDEEEASLREECISVGETDEIDIFILTTDSVPVNRKTYIEDFYDANDDVLTDAVIILVNMDPDNRGVEMQGYGQCEFSISDDRIESILDEIVPYLSDGDYYGAFSSYINEVDYYMSIEATSDYVHTEEDNQNYNENYYEESQAEEASFLETSIFNLFVSAIIGAVSVGIMVIISRVHGTADRNTYIDPKHSRILGQWDRYIRTTTTRVRKPKDNGGGSGVPGGGGVSSGGHSHSGGGRSF